MKKKAIIIGIIAIVILIFYSLTVLIKANKDFLMHSPFTKRNNLEVDTIKYNTQAIDKNFKELEYNQENIDKYCSEERVVFGKNYKKKPIIVFGCSYAYGKGLKKEQSFPALLSGLTKRPVYSFANCGFNGFDNLDNMYHFYEYEQGGKNKAIIEEAEYVIYLYMYDHAAKYIAAHTLMDHYNTMFNTSVIEEFLTTKSFLIRFIASSIRVKHILKGFPFTTRTDKYLKDCLVTLNKRTRIYAPKAKFIIVIYDETLPSPSSRSNDYIMFTAEKLSNPLWAEYEKETGSPVVHTKDLTGIVFDNNYRLKEDIVIPPDPNEKAWQKFTPLFVRKYIK